jgi:NTE family protein
MLAAGYTPSELETVLQTMDYESFKQKGIEDYFGAAGKLLSIGINFGIYGADTFEKWLEEKLAVKGVHTFGDLSGERRLLVTAADVTDKRLLIFPDDLAAFGPDPKAFSVATAVRMSMSIPIFYEPYKLKDKNGRTHYIVDGGLLSNYPVWLLDDGRETPEYPVFGFRFITGEEENGLLCKKYPRARCKPPREKPTAHEYLKSVVETALDAHDTQYVYTVKGDAERSVHIPITVEVSGKKYEIASTDFDINRLESAALFKNGLTAGARFLEGWDFEEWKKRYR